MTKVKLLVGFLSSVKGVYDAFSGLYILQFYYTGENMNNWSLIKVNKHKLFKAEFAKSPQPFFRLIGYPMFSVAAFYFYSTWTQTSMLVYSWVVFHKIEKRRFG